jgi:hypothetical protein
VSAKVTPEGVAGAMAEGMDDWPDRTEPIDMNAFPSTINALPQPGA